MLQLDNDPVEQITLSGENENSETESRSHFDNLD